MSPILWKFYKSVFTSLQNKYRAIFLIPSSYTSIAKLIMLTLRTLYKSEIEHGPSLSIWRSGLFLQIFWNAGCQLVALNFQTPGIMVAHHFMLPLTLWSLTGSILWTSSLVFNPPPNPFLWNNSIFVPMIKFNYVSRDKEKFSEPVTIFLSHPTEVLQNSHLKILGIVNMASDN